LPAELIKDPESIELWTPDLFAYTRIQIIPSGIFIVNQIQFPCSLPFFNLFFSFNSTFSILMDFVIYQYFNTIFLGKTFNQTIFMLPYSFDQVGCHTGIYCSISFTCHQVNVKLPFHINFPFSKKGCVFSRKDSIQLLYLTPLFNLLVCSMYFVFIQLK